jgi:cardiolipin synthase
LNYENNILFQDAGLSGEMRRRQVACLASSRAVTIGEVDAWPIARRLWNNLLGMLGPVL